MDESLESIFENLLINISKENRDFLVSFDWAKEIGSIAQEYGLQKTSSDVIKTLVLFAFADENERMSLAKSLQSELSMPPEVAVRIQTEIENRIFKKQLLKVPEKVIPPFNPQIQQGKNLIEDAKGNSDNIAPSVIISSATRGPQQSEPQVAPQTTLEQKIENQSNPSLSAMVKKHYPGQDPYREPIN